MNKLQERKKRAARLIKKLKQLFPNAKLALHYGNNWQLLVAVVLSAQTTDKKVNEVTAKLFKKYKTVDDFAKLTPAKLAKEIKQVGFYKTKAKNIIKTARIIKQKYGGKLPKTMKEMTALPGVARKSANVILGNAFGIVEGIAVDTHVRRLARKFDLTDYDDPVKIEQDLMKIIPKKDWFKFTYMMIEYGRKICPARRHEKECKNHPLTKIWPPAAKRWPKA